MEELSVQTRTKELNAGNDNLAMDQRQSERAKTRTPCSKVDFNFIHRMQIWRTTRPSPGTSHESEASEAPMF